MADAVAENQPAPEQQQQPEAAEPTPTTAVEEAPAADAANAVDADAEAAGAAQSDHESQPLAEADAVPAEAEAGESEEDRRRRIEQEEADQAAVVAAEQQRRDEMEKAEEEEAARRAQQEAEEAEAARIAAEKAAEEARLAQIEADRKAAAVAELQAKVDAAKQKLSDRRAEIDAKKEALAAMRSKSDIAAEQKQFATSIESNKSASTACLQRAEDAREALAVAKEVTARLQRFERFVARCTQWIDTDLTAKVSQAAVAREEKAAARVLDTLRKFTTQRDSRLAVVQRKIEERDHNASILRASNNHGHHEGGGNSPTAAGAKQRHHDASASMDQSGAMGVSTHSLKGTSIETAATPTRRGVSHSPGTARIGEAVANLPPMPTAADLANWDLEDYRVMNSFAADELRLLRKSRQETEAMRKKIVSTHHDSERKWQAEIQELTYQQKHAAQDLMNKRKRVVDLELANVSLLNSLQYQHQTLDVAWSGPVRQRFVEQARSHNSSSGKAIGSRGATTPSSSDRISARRKALEDRKAAPAASNGNHHQQSEPAAAEGQQQQQQEREQAAAPQQQRQEPSQQHDEAAAAAAPEAAADVSLPTDSNNQDANQTDAAAATSA